MYLSRWLGESGERRDDECKEPDYGATPVHPIPFRLPPQSVGPGSVGGLPSQSKSRRSLRLNGGYRLFVASLAPNPARDLDYEPQLRCLLFFVQQVAPGDRRESALRAEREPFHRHVAGGFVDALAQSVG